MPAPTQFLQDLEEDDDTNEILTEKSNTFEVYAVKIPPYRNRTGWIPRTVEVNITKWLIFNVNSSSID